MSKTAPPSPPARPLLAPCYEMFCRAALRRYCPLSVVGRENLPPPPFVLCSNHASHMDTATLMVASGLRFDRFAMLAAQDYFFGGGLGLRQSPRLFTRLVAVDRGASRESALQMISQCAALTAQGINLIMYPEGTRAIDGGIARFKKGAAFVSLRLGLPLAPAYLANTARRLPKGAFFPKPGAVRARFGAPLSPHDFEGPGGATRMNAALRDSILRLRDEDEKAFS